MHLPLSLTTTFNSEAKLLDFTEMKIIFKYDCYPGGASKLLQDNIPLDVWTIQKAVVCVKPPSSVKPTSISGDGLTDGPSLSCKTDSHAAAGVEDRVTAVDIHQLRARTGAGSPIPAQDWPLTAAQLPLV